MAAAVSANTAFVSQCLRQRLTDGYTYIFDGVVVIDVQIALRVQLNVDQRMARQLVHHMIEEAHAGGAAASAGAVEVHGSRDLRFVGIALDGSCAGHGLCRTFVRDRGVPTKATIFAQLHSPFVRLHGEAIARRTEHPIP